MGFIFGFFALALPRMRLLIAFFLALSLFDVTECGDSLVATAFRLYKVVPDVIPQPPQKRLNATWDGVEAKFGNIVSPEKVRFPHVRFPVTPYVLKDPDSPSTTCWKYSIRSIESESSSLSAVG